MYKVSFWKRAGEDYLYWAKRNKDVLKRIDDLLEAIKNNPFEGIGKPEPLKHNWTGYWSRRINQEHRLIYKLTEDTVIIYCCRAHYEEEPLW